MMEVSRKSGLYVCRDDTIKSGWESWVLIFSDAHVDSKKFDEKLFKEHMKKAHERQALAICVGDLFDAMQGRHDPRKSPEDLKEEYNVSSYYDALVCYGEDLLRPYEKVQFMFCLGNHEASVLKNNGTDLLERLVYQRNIQYDLLSAHDKVLRPHAHKLPYAGFVRFRFSSGQQNNYFSFLMYYHHGYSTNAPVTKGIIDVNRQGVELDSVDFVVNGHNHKNYYTGQPKVTVNQSDRVVSRITHYMRTPGYQCSGVESGDAFGFSVEKGSIASSKGCFWLRFYYENNKILTEVIGDIRS